MNKITTKLFIEAIVAGLGIIVASEGLKMLNKKINEHIYVVLFFSGFILHLLSEFLGINKWYCVNGNACSN